MASKIIEKNGDGNGRNLINFSDSIWHEINNFFKCNLFTHLIFGVCQYNIVQLLLTACVFLKMGAEFFSVRYLSPLPFRKKCFSN